MRWEIEGWMIEERERGRRGRGFLPWDERGGEREGGVKWWGGLEGWVDVDDYRRLLQLS